MFPITITVTDANGCQGSQSYSLIINCPNITLSPATLPNGTVNTSYSQTITASGTQGTFTFTVSSGALPPGLNLNSLTGVLSGTPNSPSTSPFNFTVTATDTISGCAGSQAYSVTINNATSSLKEVYGIGTLDAAHRIGFLFDVRSTMQGLFSYGDEAAKVTVASLSITSFTGTGRNDAGCVTFTGNGIRLENKSKVVFTVTACNSDVTGDTLSVTVKDQQGKVISSHLGRITSGDVEVR